MSPSDVLVKDILTHHVSPFLGVKDLTAASCVSKHWANAFGDKIIYINKLAAEYGLKKQDYAALIPYLKDEDYKKFYIRFARVMDNLGSNLPSLQRQKLPPGRYFQSKQIFHFLVICADNLDFFQKHYGNLDQNTLTDIGEYAIYADSRKIGDYCFDNLQNKYAFFNFTAAAGNLNYMKDLLSRKITLEVGNKRTILNLQPVILTLRAALRYGKDEVIKFLEKNYGLDPFSQKAWAAENGILKALHYLRQRELANLSEPVPSLPACVAGVSI